jgi:DNA polymerase III subunit delta
MKLAGPRALAFCDRPPASHRIALIFGSDHGLVSTAADALAKAWLPDPDPLNLVRMSDDDIKRDNRQLADELVARSLLGGMRLVRVHADRDATTKTLLETLADVDSGALVPEAYWIVEAGDLNKSSKLRVGFEASASAAALQLYADDENTISDLVAKRLAAAKASIAPDALATFAAELPGDRRLALSEIEKLELYALDLGRPITLADIQALASAEQPRGADDAADAAIAGNLAAATQSVNRFLDAGGSPISAMRTLHFRMLRLSDAGAQGGGPSARLRPPVFERDWPDFSRALRAWPPAKLQAAFTHLYEAEKACKQAGAPADAILRSLMQRIAQRQI